MQKNIFDKDIDLGQYVKDIGILDAENKKFKLKLVYQNQFEPFIFEKSETLSSELYENIQKNKDLDIISGNRPVFKQNRLNFQVI
jgi:hypothetical protein